MDPTLVRARIRGLYGLADAEASGGDPVGLGLALLAGGCRLIQLRAKGWQEPALLDAARALLPACEAVGAWLIINDSITVALSAGAHGVHLGQTDQAATEARARLGPAKLIGVSCHKPEDLAEAGPIADYLAFGPVFPTPNLSRPKPVRGLAALQEARIHAGSRPLVAIGGITLARLPEVRAAGADAWAVIGAIASSPDPTAATAALMQAGAHAA